MRNEGPDLRPRLQREGEFELKRILGRHDVLDPGNLLGCQALRSPHRLAGPQRVPAAAAVRRQPDENPVRVKAHVPGDSRWRLSRLNPPDSLKTRLLQLRVADLSTVDSHGRIRS